MTLRLGLDTSTRLGSVALAEGPELLGESLLSVRAAASEAAMPEVDRLLHAAGRSARDLDAVVVGAGPGSFTGVRIAAALAKGLCFGLGVPLVAHGSLLAVAAGTGLGSPVCALFDARRGQLYAAAYRGSPAGDALPEPTLGPAAVGVEELLSRLGGAGGWTFAGDGAVAHADALRRAGGRVLPPNLGHPRASTLLWLAERYPDAGRVKEVAGWEPLYVRRSGADRRAMAGGAA